MSTTTRRSPRTQRSHEFTDRAMRRMPKGYHDHTPPGPHPSQQQQQQQQQQLDHHPRSRSSSSTKDGGGYASRREAQLRRDRGWTSEFASNKYADDVALAAGAPRTDKKPLSTFRKRPPKKPSDGWREAVIFDSNDGRDDGGEEDGYDDDDGGASNNNNSKKKKKKKKKTTRQTKGSRSRGSASPLNRRVRFAPAANHSDVTGGGVGNPDRPPRRRAHKSPNKSHGLRTAAAAVPAGQNNDDHGGALSAAASSSPTGTGTGEIGGETASFEIGDRVVSKGSDQVVN